MPRHSYTIVAAIVLAATACADASAPDRPGRARVIDLTPAPAIVDGSSGGDEHFFWLPPVAPVRAYPGTFDPLASPELRICPFANGACTVAPTIYTRTSSPAIALDTLTPAFTFDWSTKAPGIDAGTYRAEVRVSNRLLGYADLRVAANAKDLKNVPAGFVGVQDGKSLTLAFRIENGIVGSVSIAPRDSSLTIGDVRQFNATVRDIHGAVISGASVSWTSRQPSVATISASGLATGVGTGVTTIVAMSGGVSDSTSLTVGPVPVARVVVSPATLIALIPGQTVNFTAVTLDAGGHMLSGRSVEWSTNNASVVTIGPDGRATASGPGISFIVASSEGKRDSTFVDVTSGATVSCLRPWTLPEVWFLSNVVGQRVTGRLGPLFGAVQPTPTSGEYYPLALGGSSSATYTSNIESCTPVTVTLGDSVDLQLGNQSSTTVAGLDSLFALDPNAAWDSTANGGQGGIVNSNAAPGAESARVVQVALYIFGGSSGASRVPVGRTAFVFLDSYVRVSGTPPGGQRGDITFRFLRFGP